MNIFEYFYRWAYKSHRLINPSKILRFLLVVYFLMYLFDVGSNIREAIFVIGISIFGILYYIENLFKRFAVAGKTQIKEVFQREDKWINEVKVSHSNLQKFMTPYMSWCDDFSLILIDGRWIVYVRWSDEDKGVFERQVEAWPFFRHIIQTDHMSSQVFAELPQYLPPTRILNA